MIVKADQPDQPPIDLEAMPHWRCTSQRYLELISSGTLGPKDKVELINGIITAMSSAGPEHDYAIMQLTELLMPVLPKYHLKIQSTINLGEGQIFDPDLAAIKRRGGDSYKHKHAGPDDILLIIEAAASSMKRDATVKMPIYARAGIPEYWIVDIEDKSQIIHRDPQEAIYADVQTIHGDTAVQASSVEGLSLTPAAIFG